MNIIDEIKGELERVAFKLLDKKHRDLQEVDRLLCANGLELTVDSHGRHHDMLAEVCKLKEHGFELTFDIKSLLPPGPPKKEWRTIGC